MVQNSQLYLQLLNTLIEIAIVIMAEQTFDLSWENVHEIVACLSSLQNIYYKSYTRYIKRKGW